MEVQEYPGNFWFHEDGLPLSTYVDDLTLAGPRAAHAPFWDKLCALVNVEPPEPIYRILGRNHVYVKHTLEDKTKIEALAFDMCDYAQQTVDLYKAITKTEKIKGASTPFLPEGSLLPQDEEVTGELAGNAAKILMKALWLARLARPDILRPINDLATRVQRWTRADDKRVLRLVQYLQSSLYYRLIGYIGLEDVRLRLYVDADFAGETKDAKSSSGGYLVLVGEKTYFPLVWVSKKQTSVSRSTTESEIVSLAHSLFAEAIPALQLWTLLTGCNMRLEIEEDNQATIIVAKRGYSPKLRHISRTHKVNLGSIAEILEDEDICIEYIDTNEQAADIFTKTLPPNKWDKRLTS